MLKRSVKNSPTHGRIVIFVSLTYRSCCSPCKGFGTLPSLLILWSMYILCRTHHSFFFFVYFLPFSFFSFSFTFFLFPFFSFSFTFFLFPFFLFRLLSSFFLFFFFVYFLPFSFFTFSFIFFLFPFLFYFPLKIRMTYVYVLQH